MTVTLKKSSKRHALTLGNVYRVIGIEADDYRLIDDNGRPYLFPPGLFSIVKPSRPRDWRVSFGDNGEAYAYPPELDRPGFFEDVFEGKRAALQALYAYLERPRPRRRAVA